MLNWKFTCVFLAIFLICAQYIFIVEKIFSSKVPSEKYLPNNKTSFNETIIIKPRFLSSHFASTGRLGNHLFEMVSLFGISKRLNRVPIFFIHDGSYQTMFEYTKDIIPGLTDQYLVVNGTTVSGFKRVGFPNQCCGFDNPERLENITETFLSLTGIYYQSWKYFPDDRKNIISYLKPKDDFGALPKSNDKIIITCIHVRRTDFVSQHRFTADENFIIKASEFIDKKRESGDQKREKVVVLFGDDQKFMTNVFDNKTRHHVSKNTPIEDLLYASKHCNNVLITAPVSTFGWWMGYLSGHDNVFYVDVRKVDDVLFKSGSFNPTDFFLPQWTPLKLDKDNVTVVESSET